MRKIIHIDMDAFYAAVEQRDNPAYRGKPVVVGGQPNSRGVVATASYEARRFGIHSAMPSAHAYRLCPKAIFVVPRFHVYHEVSDEIMEILRGYTELLETVSLDEAYLDVTQHKDRYAREIAKEIKARIFAATGLTASAGVAANKFIAKIASDMRKPDGLTVVRPEQAIAFLADLPVRRIPGVGPVTEARLKNAGFWFIRDLQDRSEQDLTELFGGLGAWLAELAQGIDEREVEPERERKSLGTEETYERDLTTIDEMSEEIAQLAERVAEDLQERDLKGRTITLKVTYADFEKITRRTTIDGYTSDRTVIEQLARELLVRTEAGSRPVRLLGVTVSGFKPLEEDLPLQLVFPFMRRHSP